MTELDYGGGGHRTRLKDQQINCFILGVPLPPYIKEQGGGVAGQGGGAPGGVLLPPGLGLPPFLVGIGEGGKRWRRGRKGRAAPLSLSY